MSNTITMGKIMEVWEKAFMAGYDAGQVDRDMGEIDAKNAFEIWWREEEAKLLK